MKNVKTTVIYLIFFTLVIGGLVWFGSNSKSETPPASADEKFTGSLILEESKYDFGKVSMAKGKVYKEFVLENQSNGDVKIGEVYTSCMCTLAELKSGDKFAGPFGMQGHGLSLKANLITKPGETLTVKTIFDPAAHGPAGIGPIERQVAIFTSAAKEPIILEFKAVVTP